MIMGPIVASSCCICTATHHVYLTQHNVDARGTLRQEHSDIFAGFKYPVSLSGLGQGFSALAAFATCHLLKWVSAEKRVDSKFFASRMLPVGFFNATTLMFGNAVYMYLSVAFIQMLKALTPVITMVGLFLASMEVRTLIFTTFNV
jgi:hypothetical protein